MDNNKEIFHQISSSLEYKLLEFQTGHPVNIGAMLRKYMLANVFMIGSLGYFVILPLPIEVNLAFALIALIICGGAIYIFSPDCEKKITKLVNDDKARLKELSEYPDVNYYLQEFDKGLSAAIASKKQIVKKAQIIFALMGLFNVGIYLYAATLVYDAHAGGGYHNARLSGIYYDYLDVDDQKPFLTLKIFSSGSQDVNNTDLPSVDFYFIEQRDKTFLRAVKRSSSSDWFEGNHLYIAYGDGRPVPHCPLFNYVNYKQMDSDNLESGIGYYDNSFNIIHTMRFLKKNQGHLRFVIEKDN